MKTAPWVFRSRLGVIFLTGSIVFLMATSVRSESLESLRDLLPKKISGWTAAPQDDFYDEQSIFRYIDGAGEVYKAYNMKRCLSRRYVVEDGPAIVMDIFDMGSSKDAFGVFTHDTEGKEAGIGQDSRYRPGWLSFWKDRFFVSIYTEEETEASEKGVLSLGKEVSAAIPKEGTRPEILSRLPQKGLQAEEVRYLHHPVILNTHFYLSDENILNVTDRTEAVLAPYRQGEASALLLLVRYPDEAAAKQSMESFLTHYLPEARGTGSALLENRKWSAARVEGRLLSVVLEADTREYAENLLKAVN